LQKTTSKKAATASSKTLRDSRTSNDSKSAAWSALSQRKAPAKQTHAKVAKIASKVLKSDSTWTKSKTAAWSALSQKPRGKEVDFIF